MIASARKTKIIVLPTPAFSSLDSFSIIFGRVLSPKSFAVLFHFSDMEFVLKTFTIVSELGTSGGTSDTKNTDWVCPSARSIKKQCTRVVVD